MKRVKMMLMAVAIIGGVSGASAISVTGHCTNKPQFVQFGDMYFEAGQFGVDYGCMNTAGVCTFYQSDPTDPNSMIPCRTGAFFWMY